MVSFVCDYCQETLKKAKLDQHTYKCYNAQFSCVDCSVTFKGDEYRLHTSCISEAEKYQKTVYKGPKKQQIQQQTPASTPPQNIAKQVVSESLIAQIKKTEVVVVGVETGTKRKSEVDGDVDVDVDVKRKKEKKSKKENGGDTNNGVQESEVKEEKKEKKDKKVKKEKEKKSVQGVDREMGTEWDTTSLQEFEKSVPRAVRFVLSKKNDLSYTKLKKRVIKLFLKHPLNVASEDELAVYIDDHVVLSIRDGVVTVQ